MYYPGSKKSVKTFETPSQPRREEVYAEFLLGKGREFAVGHEVKEFYPIGRLADALNRQQVTIRKWEADGVIPKATFIMPGQNQDKRGQRRLYTREQILGLREVAKEEGLLEPNENGKWKSIEETKFKERALTLFKELESK
jgi:hypothetical protein